MLKNKGFFYTVSGLFVIAELILSVLLQTLDGRGAVHASYTVVVLSALSCFLFMARQKDYILTQTALLFTLLADYFLVLSPIQRQLPAMLFFSVTQLCYAARIWCHEPTPARRRLHLWVRGAVAAFALLLTFSVLGERTDALSMVSLFYFANLLCNLLFAFLQWKRAPLLALGLLFFACCDVFVGLSCLDAYFVIDKASLFYRIIHPGVNLPWVFYVPAKILLPLSLYSTTYEEMKK